MSDFRITRNSISPDLARMVSALRDRRPVLEAMGTTLAALTRRTWRDAALRALPWPATQTGRPPLYKSGALVQSIRVAAVVSSKPGEVREDARPPGAGVCVDCRGGGESPREPLPDKPLRMFSKSRCY